MNYQEFSRLNKRFLEEKESNPDADWFLYELFLEYRKGKKFSDLVSDNEFLKIVYVLLRQWMKAVGIGGKKRGVLKFKELYLFS